MSKRYFPSRNSKNPIKLPQAQTQITDILKMNDNENTIYLQETKSVIRGKFIVLNTYISTNESE